MSESDYIKATNLAKIKIAYTVMRDTMAGYGPLTEPQYQNIVGLLGDLLDRFFNSMNEEVGSDG